MTRVMALVVVLALIAGAGVGWVAHDAVHPAKVHVVVENPKRADFAVSVDGPVETCADTNYLSAKALLECSNP